MTFNQWCAGRALDSSSRLAFEAVWNVLVGGGCRAIEASSLLADLFESIPEFDLADEDEDKW